MTEAQEQTDSDRRRGRGFIAILILLAGIGALEWAFWSQGLEAIPGTPRSDFEYYFLPQRAFLGRWVAQGVLPFWNPHLFGGYPVVEVSQTALFYPLHLLSLWLVPEALPGLRTELALHLALAPLLMAWVLARGFGMDGRGAAGAALAFAGSTAFQYRFFAGHLTVIFALTWLPVAILAAVAACGASCKEPRSRMRGHWWLVAGLAAVMVNLAGSPQYFYYCFYGQLVAVVAAAWGSGWRQIRGELGRFGAVFLTGLLVAAPQWLSTALYVPYAARQSGSYLEVLSTRGLGMLLMEFLLPLPFGSGVDDYHLNRKGVWETTSHPGTVAVVLAVIGLAATWRVWRTRQEWTAEGERKTALSRAAGALILLGVALLLGLGPPGASLFREPGRGLVLIVLGATVAAGLTLDGLASGRTTGASAHFLRIGGAVAGLFALGWIGLRLLIILSPSIGRRLILWFTEPDSVRFGDTVLAFEALRSDPRPFLERFGGAIEMSLVWTGVVAAFLMAARRWPQVAVSALAVCLAGAALSVSLPVHVAALPFSETGWPPGLEPKLESRLADARSRKKAWSVSLPPNFINTAQYLEGLHSDSGYDPLAPRGSGTRQPVRAPREPRPSALVRRDLANAIRYRIVETPSTAEDYLPRMARRVVRVEQGPAAASLVTLSTRFAFGKEDDSQIYAFGPLADGSDLLDTRDRDVVATWLGGHSGQTTVPMEQLRVHGIDSPAPHELRFRAAGPAGIPTLAIVRSTWLPGWTATVDSSPVPALRANGWMIAVPLPADGQFHTVALIYRPPFFKLALALSGLGCLLVLLGLRKPAVHKAVFSWTSICRAVITSWTKQKEARVR